MYYKDHMDYEPPSWEDDPIWQEAEAYAEASLEGIRDDLNDETYYRELRRLTQVEYGRLLEQYRAEYEAEKEADESGWFDRYQFGPEDFGE